MTQGTVKWFNDLKNFGFLTTDDGEDVFIHRSGVKDTQAYPLLLTGDKVQFEIAMHKGKTTATDVVVLDEDEDD